MNRPESIRLPLFFLLSILTGVMAGISVVVFRRLIAIAHNLFFEGRLSWLYNANLHTPASPWGAWVILVPVLGAVIVIFLIRNFAPEASGNGIPEVMDTIYYRRGRIRPIVAAVKAIASATSIGSGAPVGREGPIVQIASTFGSVIGQYFPMADWQRVALVTAGASGGIAATFNAPVGGIIFVIEVMMPELSVNTLVPVVLASVTATYVGRLFLGPHPSFVVPTLEHVTFFLPGIAQLTAYALLGIIIGVISAGFIKSIYSTEDMYQRIKNPYLRHMTGMLLVGTMMYLLFINTGHYQIQGVGYATIQDILEGAPLSTGLLILLLVLKIVATSSSLGSGSAGGVFSPSLYVGAAFGATYGAWLESWFPSLGLQPAVVAVAGMAAAVGGATGAVLGSIVMIYEMTLAYDVILPMTITVAVAYGVRRALQRESVYAAKLVRRGRRVPDALHANIIYLRQARDAAFTELVTAYLDSPAETVAGSIRSYLERDLLPYVLLADRQDHLQGVITEECAIASLAEDGQIQKVTHVTETHFGYVQPDAGLLEVVYRMRTEGVDTVLVLDGDSATRPVSISNIRGIITRRQLGNSLIDASGLFSH